MARALLFSTKVPKYLWGEDVLTAAHLINRMSSRVLNLKTHLETFLKFFPIDSVAANMPLKIFGCTAFVHEHKQIGKLELVLLNVSLLDNPPLKKDINVLIPILNGCW